MTVRVLVAHASKHGATIEIAQKITEVLQESGLQVTLLPAEQVDDLTPFDAVVLGSAVYAGSWRSEAKQFLEEYQMGLRKIPVWLFSSGPLGNGEPSELISGWQFPTALKPLVERIHPREIALFHGVIDMEKLNFAEKLIIKGVRPPVGDFRDWDSICDWAASIADELHTEPVK